MGLKSFLVSIYAKKVARDVKSWSRKALESQDELMFSLIKDASNTKFGVDHDFSSIKSYDDFKKQVLIRDYEDLRPYIDLVTKGEKDILWPGKPKYFAKTSGTTSGVKYIPITNDSMSNHINSARIAMLNNIASREDASVFDGKMIFLSGSPVLDEKGGVATGRLSGIVNHEIPAWIKTNQLPSYETNCIDDWETKLDKIIDETLGQDMRLISGIPPWVQMYYERLIERTGKSTVIEIFPNLNLFIYGGVNFEPYRAKINSLVGKEIASVELYPASEGFIAFQNDPESTDLLLITNSGIFFEFIPYDEVFKEEPLRLRLHEVQIGVDYALIIHNNAGLWGYSIGDLVRFTSIDPYKIVVSGRIKHFISAFGEHVIGKEVEEALNHVVKEYQASIVEFTVAPQVNPVEGLPYHEWFIEFGQMPDDLPQFAKELDNLMTVKNIYYQDLIAGGILRQLVITVMQKDAFRNYMKDNGKLGGQNKVPRLSNDRKIADQLVAYRIK
jgi:hypothetical protein